MLPRATAQNTVDRTACPWHRHGTAAAYSNGCRCPDARADMRRYRKHYEAGLLPDYLVDGTGLRRRLQALAAVGWSPAELADRLGWTQRALQDARQARRAGRDRVSDVAELVLREKHEQVAALYRELIDRQPPKTHRWSITWARKLGWPPPGAWDDIDDPDEQPEPTDLRGGQQELPMADVLELLADGEHPAHVARRAGLTVDALERRVQRYRASHNTVPEAVITAIRDEYRATRHTTWSGKACAARHGVSTFLVSKTIHGQVRPELGLTDLTRSTAPNSDGAAHTHQAASPAGCTDRKEPAA